jgi:SAM-dependent methyltransferase
MSIHYKSIEIYLRRFLQKDSLNKILEIGAAEDSTYLASLTNTNIYRSNINTSINNVMHFPANQLPFDDNIFDLVFMIATDYFIEDIESTLTEILRVLKPNSSLCILTYKEKTLEKLRVLNKTLGVVSYNHLLDYSRLSKEMFLKVEFTQIDNDYSSKNHKFDFIRSEIYKLLPYSLRLARSPWLAINIKNRG